MSAAPDSPFPIGEPTRALLLAQALDACIEAERLVPGSAEQVIARQPAWARAELRRLVTLAESLDAVGDNAVMSDDFKSDARWRLMQRIGGDDNARDPIRGWFATQPSHAGQPAVKSRRSRRWAWRSGVGGMLAAALVAGATLTASANALPGEPLYGVKQAQEDLGVRLAPDEQARALALLNQGDARLDETARLLQAGRTEDAAQTTQRFNDAIDRATMTFVTIVDQPPDQPANATIATRLDEQQAQLQAMLATAPEPARADLRQALVATERGRALLAETPTIGQDAVVAPDFSGNAQVAASDPVPTMAAEAEPTVVVKVARRAPPPVDLVAAQPDRQPQATTNADEASTDATEPLTALAPSAPAGDVGSSTPPPPPPVSLPSDNKRSQGRSNESSNEAQLPPRPLQIKLDAVPAAPANVVVGGAPAGSGEDDAHANTDPPAPPAQSDGGHTRVVEPAHTSQPAVAAQESGASDNAHADNNPGRSVSPATNAQPAVVAQAGHSGGNGNGDGNAGSDAGNSPHTANYGGGNNAGGAAAVATEAHSSNPPAVASTNTHAQQPAALATATASDHHANGESTINGGGGDGGKQPTGATSPTSSNSSPSPHGNGGGGGDGHNGGGNGNGNPAGSGHGHGD